VIPRSLVATVCLLTCGIELPAAPPIYGRTNPYAGDPYRPVPYYAAPRSYRSYGPATYRPVYTYPPAYWTYRPWYGYPSAFWSYTEPGFPYRGDSLPPTAMPGYQLAW
jgi:hypothetical protein